MTLQTGGNGGDRPPLLPTEGWKTYAGVAVCCVAALGLWTHLADLPTATGTFMFGVGLIGVGLKAASARIEKGVAETKAIATQGTGAATVAAIQASTAADAATAAAAKETN